MTALHDLVDLIQVGFPADGDRKQLANATETTIDGLFGERYHSRSHYAKRIAFMPGDDNVPFAGLLHPNNPSSGVYGGMSLIWFPVGSEGDKPPSSLLTLVCGTKGLDPDAAILGRPGHVRYLHALRRHLAQKLGVKLWVKNDPTDLSQSFPDMIRKEYPQYSRVIDRYGRYIYAAIDVPQNTEKGYAVVTALLDFYAKERGWTALKSAADEVREHQQLLRANLWPRVDHETIHRLLSERRYIILQGPPGTGKTRLARELLQKQFNNCGRVVQFHPAITYENFVVGITPTVNQSTLNFEVKRGWLADVIDKAQNSPYLLVIDEINRADLGRVLGEAIYLFEPREVSEGQPRTVDLPYSIDGKSSLTISPNLYVIGTMNSADRSIAIMDLAVRRRFAFIDVWPDIEVVQREGRDIAVRAFGALLDIFTQYAPNDALTLMPGHAYFLAQSDTELINRIKYELIPLLHEYLHEGRLGPCETEVRAYITWLEGEITQYA